MTHSPPTITFLRAADQTPYAQSARPRKVTLKETMGARQSRLWVEFYDPPPSAPVYLGDLLEVWVEEIRFFRGPIEQIRQDSIDDRLTLYAEDDAARHYAYSAGGLFTDSTPTEILTQLLAESPIAYTPDPPSARHFSRLAFPAGPLIEAIDLLAKLAGNWAWDLADHQLRLRPLCANDAHHRRLVADRDTVNLWLTNQDRPAQVVFQTGLMNGAVRTSRLLNPNPHFPSEPTEVVYEAPPIQSPDALAALRHSTLQHLLTPHYGHAIDLAGPQPHLRAGDGIRFSAPQWPWFPEAHCFRIKQRELRYAHERYHTRLFLTTGHENGAGYFTYLKRKRTSTIAYQLAVSGAFQLDVSALDSDAHLDAA